MQACRGSLSFGVLLAVAGCSAARPVAPALPGEETAAAAATMPSAPAAESCSIDRGCGDRSPQPLPRCTSRVAAQPLAPLLERLQRGEVAAGPVVFEGHLRWITGECLAVACQGRCCSTCNYWLIVAPSADLNRRPDSQGYIGLESGFGRDGDFLCSGDPTLVCCPYPADGTRVRVTATVRAGGGRHALMATVSELCAPSENEGGRSS